MEQKISPQIVKHVARLARLALDEPHVTKYASQLESILHYVEQIDAVNVEGVEPMAHPLPLANVLRDDVPTAALSLEEALRNAPESDGPFFKVPKVIGGDEDSAG